MDVSGSEGRDPIEDYEKINSELKKYNEKLSHKLQIVAANKTDLPESAENLERLQSYMKAAGREVYPICALTGEGLPQLMERLWTLLTEYVEEPEKTEDEVVYKLEEKPDFEVKRDATGVFIITGPRIERLVAMTNFDDDMKERQVELRGDDRTCTCSEQVKQAGDDDWATEYNALIMSIRAVASMSLSTTNVIFMT